jgi:transposase
MQLFQSSSVDGHVIGRRKLAMEMNYPSLITESVEDLHGLEHAERRTGRSDRLRMLRLLKSSTVPTVTQAASVLGYTVRTLQNWWRAYREGGVPGLLPSPRPAGGRERITPEAWQGLQEEMRAGHVGGLNEAQAYLRDHWHIDYGIDAISKLFKRRKTKLKTGRRRHHRAASADAQAAFKKGLRPDARRA